MEPGLRVSALPSHVARSLSKSLCEVSEFGTDAKRGITAEMLIFLPNTLEDLINRHQKLKTVPPDVFFPTSAGLPRVGAGTRILGCRVTRPAGAQESSTGSSRVQAPVLLRRPSPSLRTPSISRTPFPLSTINKVNGSGFKWGGVGD